MLPKSYLNRPIWDLEFENLHRGKKIFYSDKGIKEAIYLGKVRSLVDLIPIAYNRVDEKYLNLFERNFFKTREEIDKEFTTIESIIGNILDLDEIKKIAEVSDEKTADSIMDLFSP